MHLASVVRYKRLLGHEQIRHVAGALVHGRMLDEPLGADLLAELTYQEQVQLNQVPDLTIAKLARSEHVETFFATGQLRLGTFKYFAAFEHAEVGDKTEGSVLSVGQGPRSTVFADIAGGFDNYVFCCYAGGVDTADVRARFGYDAGYEIKSVPDFSAAISKTLNATSKSYGLCVYRRHKVLVSVGPERLIKSEISAKLLELVGRAKYFIKPDIYSHQSEFRFVWQAASDVEAPLDILCPEAASSCRRMNVA